MDSVMAKKFYYFNRQFFHDLFLFLKGNIFLLNAISNENILCSAIIYVNENIAHYFLSGTQKQISNNSVNNYLLNEAVIFAQGNQCKYFDFGGGNSIEENDRLFKFKSNFSKNVECFYIGNKIFNKSIYDKIVIQWKNRNKNHKMFSNICLKYRILE